MIDGSSLPAPGDTIAGKYMLERVIGQGGMSVVYGATHRVTGKRFAIKWMLPDQTPTSGDTARRFIREAQVAGLFQHPNVVEVYDVGQVSGSFYMVMEWLDGESLATRLERTGAMLFDEMCTYLIPCMHGVTEAHAAGIVHRDLKPANIFLCRAMHHTPERPKVLDFGIAKISARTFDVNSLVTKSGVLIGTPHYLSPEQLRSLPVDHRTDIYALGVIMYQLLTGQLPFPADNFGALVLQIATGTPLPLNEAAKDLPDGVAEVVEQAMAREPAARHQDLRDLIAALEDLRGEQRDSAPGFSRRTPHPGASSSAPDRTPRPSPPPLPRGSNTGDSQRLDSLSGSSEFEPESETPAKKVWAYAAVAAVLVIACIALAKLWMSQPSAAGLDSKRQPEQAKTGAPVTTTNAATTPASEANTPQPSAAATAETGSTQAAQPNMNAPDENEQAAAAAAAEARHEGSIQPKATGTEATAKPRRQPKQSVQASTPASTDQAQHPAAPPPIDKNPLHMKLQ